MRDDHKNDGLILIVDDETQMRRLFLSTLQYNGFAACMAGSGEEALKILETENVAVVISDICMPGMDGIILTEKIKETSCADVILITGSSKGFSYEKAVEKGASDFIQKPFEMNELIIRLTRVLKEREMRATLKRRLRQLFDVLKGIVHALSLSIEARDPYTAGHQKRVANLAAAIAKEMGLPKEQITGIRMAGVIHDLGKIAVPAEILSKPSKLSDIEFSLIKTHPRVGYDILKNIDFPWPIAEIIYQHHERMDGSGYPRGLIGEDIILEARIMAVADVVEAIASHRPYRPSLGLQAAFEELKLGRGVGFNPEVVDACLNIIGKEDFSFEEV